MTTFGFTVASWDREPGDFLRSERTENANLRIVTYTKFRTLPSEERARLHGSARFATLSATSVPNSPKAGADSRRPSPKAPRNQFSHYPSTTGASSRRPPAADHKPADT